MSNDTLVLQQSFNILILKLRDCFHLKILESVAKHLSLFQDRDPTQAGLKSLKTDLLKHAAVILYRPAPLAIMVSNIDRQIRAPPATWNIGVVSYDVFFHCRTFTARGTAQ